MARLVIVALAFAHTAAAFDGNGGRSLRSCNYRCPDNSRRKPNRKCYDTFDDCECDRGFKRVGKRCEKACDNAYQCPRNSQRKPNRNCYDTFDDCECKRGFKKSGRACVPEFEEPCFQIYCSSGSVLVGADSRGCGGRCEVKLEEPCFQINCSPGSVLVDADSRGCGGRCEVKLEEPCFQINCSPGSVLVGADSRGCGGRCEVDFTGLRGAQGGCLADGKYCGERGFKLSIPCCGGATCQQSFGTDKMYCSKESTCLAKDQVCGHGGFKISKECCSGMKCVAASHRDPFGEMRCKPSNPFDLR